ncbi:MAG: flagellar biosynthetic protein FliO [Thiotrichales bacterium]
MSRKSDNFKPVKVKKATRYGLWVTATSLLLCSAPAISAETTTGPASDIAQFSRFGIALIFVLILIFSLAWLAKKFNVTSLTRNNSDQLKVIAALPVGTRERVIMVEANGQKLLLGVTADRINTLHEFPETPLPTSSGFAETLEKTVSESKAEKPE